MHSQDLDGGRGAAGAQAAVLMRAPAAVLARASTAAAAHVPVLAPARWVDGVFWVY